MTSSAPFDPLDGRISRRHVIGQGAVTFAGLVGAGLIDPSSVLARRNAAPRPIPGGLDASFKPVPSHPAFHTFGPGLGQEMSTITDFNGVVAGSEIRGRAHGSDGSTWDFDTDMRFMTGTYVGFDGRTRKGSFGFV